MKKLRTEAAMTIGNAGLALAVLLLLASSPPLIAETEPADADGNQADASVSPTTYGKYLASRHALQVRDYRAAADFYDEVLAGGLVDGIVLRDAFIAFSTEGRFAEAVAVGRRIVDLGSKSDTPILVLAIQEAKAGNHAAATALLDELPPTGLNQHTMPLIRAWIALDSGRAEEAIAAIDALSGVPEMEALRQLHLALVSELAGNKAGAENAYAAAIAEDDRLSYRLVELTGNYYERTKQKDKARQLYARFQAVFPDSSLIPMLLTAVDRSGERRALVGSPRDGLAEALFDLASALNRPEMAAYAMLYVRLALDLKPEFPSAQLLLGDLLTGGERWPEAVAVYREIERKTPLGWDAQLSMASNLDRLDRTDEAVDLLKRMAKDRPETSDALILLGDIFRRRELHAESASAYDQAFARIGEPRQQHWTLLYYRGIALERSQQWPRAEADFKKALELQPDEPFVLNYLAYSWVELGQHYDEALDMLTRAVEMRPDDGFIVDSLGWVYYRVGQYDKAVEYLERAVELEPQDPTINDHFGDALWRVGRRAEARFQWKRALNMSPEEDQVAPIQTKLEQGLPDSKSGT